MTALTWLYVPADRPDRVVKAFASGADVVIVDLEDAVAPDRKSYARDAAKDVLAEPAPVPVHVRVNALDGPLADADIAALAGLPGVSGLRLPKVVDPLDVRRVAERAPGLALVPLLESALGVERAFEIASAGVAGIALGEADLSADLSLSTEDGLTWARSRVIVAARAAGLPPPAQSVYTNVRDLEGLRRSCERGRALGFLGRAAIHPAQLETIANAYRPTETELARAREIVEAALTDAGALALPDGRFVDAALVEGARRTLSLAGE
ncbi:HpcH/HpaI aldolase/citrate lyase family protein [Allokutzneria albata]|uniref:Citrate lyase subunit beta / citryl-CoA lyase n=1 Tax=Allokutzneria albata TaxID=211114 RepID=A0A1G9VG78_ALLAB|nr:CoA ester lyase [Allokutzneria albata]SDM71083.1 citrate lyase subunit beta / citryl-CoA lyase [Allokutzneria albata]